MRKSEFKTIKCEDGFWRVVSKLYKPASAGNIGSGIYDCHPYKTKREAEQVRKEYEKSF